MAIMMVLGCMFMAVFFGVLPALVYVRHKDNERATRDMVFACFWVLFAILISAWK